MDQRRALATDRLADVAQVGVAPVGRLELVVDLVALGPVGREPQLAPVGLPGLDLRLLGQLQHELVGHAVHDDGRSRVLHLDQHDATTLGASTDIDPAPDSLVHMAGT